jgi:hypothetical protein
MAAGDLTTLANVRQWINIASTSDDALLSRLITSVSNFIQSWLNRVLTSSAYVETYNGRDGGTFMLLANYPITAVASLSIDGVPIPPGGSPLVQGFAFDATKIVLYGYQFTAGINNVAVSYTAGYATPPVEIEQACIELVSLRYAERLRPGVASRGLAGETTTYTPVALTDSIKETLGQYKKVVPT